VLLPEINQLVDGIMLTDASECENGMKRMGVPAPNGMCAISTLETSNTRECPTDNRDIGSIHEVNVFSTVTATISILMDRLTIFLVIDSWERMIAIR
jgi:hypothetical protein